MDRLIKKKAREGKSMMVFCGLWFTTSTVLFVVEGSMAAGVMSVAGIFIFMGLNTEVGKDRNDIPEV